MENNSHKANWVWTVLLVGIAAYFHWIVVGLHIETSRLSEEREALLVQSEEFLVRSEEFRDGLEARTEEIAQFQNTFRADVYEATKSLRGLLKGVGDNDISATSTVYQGLERSSGFREEDWLFGDEDNSRGFR